MNRELFIGAIDLTEHVFMVVPYYMTERFYTFGADPKRYQGWNIHLSHLEDAMIYNLKQSCIYNPRPIVFFNGYGFKIQLSDFNDYSLKVCESVSMGVELVLIFEQEYRTFTMQGRFGR